MLTHSHSVQRGTRLLALTLAAVLAVPTLIGCGQPRSNTSDSNLPPIDDTRGGMSPRSSRTERPTQGRRGMSTGQKVALLAGAAALYYMYQKNKNKQGVGQQGQYYLSKNGRVYYRDENGRAHWVTPPREGIRVPADEADRYRDYQGYNGQQSGRGFGGYGEGGGSPELSGSDRY